MTGRDLITVGVAARRAGDGSGREIRLQAHMSIRRMAALLGTAEATVSRWETGRRQPRGAAAIRWVHLLDDLERAQRNGQ